MNPSTSTSPEHSPNHNITEISQKYYNKNQRKLNLYNCGDDWQKIICSRDWSQVQILCITFCRIKDDGAEMLAKMEWPNLQQLDIGSDHLTSKTIQTLLSKPHPILKTLRLWKNNIGNKGLQLLATTDNLPKLEVLNVIWNQITGEGLRWVMGGGFGGLRELFLGSNQVGSVGIKYLVKAHLPRLQKLQLNGCKLSTQGILHLQKSIHPNLKSLQLTQKHLTYSDISPISLNSWHKLQQIAISLEFGRSFDPLVVMGVVSAGWGVKGGVGVRLRGGGERLGKWVGMREVVQGRFRV